MLVGSEKSEVIRAQFLKALSDPETASLSANRGAIRLGGGFALLNSRKSFQAKRLEAHGSAMSRSVAERFAGFGESPSFRIRIQ
jgi:hypothetical protein